MTIEGVVPLLLYEAEFAVGCITNFVTDFERRLDLLTDLLGEQCLRAVIPIRRSDLGVRQTDKAVARL